MEALCPMCKVPTTVVVIDVWDDGMELQCDECKEVWVEDIAN